MNSTISTFVRNLVILGAAVALCGCATTKRDWQKANREGTIQAYEQFLQNHPDSDQASQARSLLKHLQSEASWKTAQSADRMSVYSVFLDNYPDSEHAAQARQRMFSLKAQQAWTSTRTANTVEALEEFLKTYGSSQYASEARQRLVALQGPQAWQSAKATNTVAALDAFLKNYGASKYASEAKAHLESLLLAQTFQVHEAMQYAKELKTLPIQIGVFAKNITVESSGSTLQYGGSLIQALGKAYAQVPSLHPWIPIDSTMFMIVKLDDIPQRPSDIIAQTKAGPVPIGYTFDTVGQNLSDMFGKRGVPKGMAEALREMNNSNPSATGH